MYVQPYFKHEFSQHYYIMKYLSMLLNLASKIHQYQHESNNKKIELDTQQFYVKYIGFK